MWNGAYGYEYIPFTGLYHVSAREYDPRTARWLQRDPIDAASGDPNLYRYAGNTPVNRADPDGLDPNWGALFDIGIGFVPMVGSLWDTGKQKLLLVGQQELMTVVRPIDIDESSPHLFQHHWDRRDGLRADVHRLG